MYDFENYRDKYRFLILGYIASGEKSYHDVCEFINVCDLYKEYLISADEIMIIILELEEDQDIIYSEDSDNWVLNPLSVNIEYCDV
tara:strand:- start:142 stop:399 length:258 start_codon:yes stop_codon:yes gene_type:complete